MARKITKEELIKHKAEALDKLNNYIDFLISSEDEKICSKADKLSYWLKDYTKFLSYEQDFKPKSLRRYKRGEIIKVHLGYNIGSEEGGLHYCVVLDKKNSIYSPVITVVPLNSLKPGTDISNLRNGEVYLGNELFTNLNSKVSTCNKKVSDELKHLMEKLKEVKEDKPSYADNIEEIKSRIKMVTDNQKLLDRMRAEVFKMKKEV